MSGYQFLVGSADTYTALKGFFGKGVGRLPASHSLADHRDLTVRKDILIIVGHSVVIGIAGKIAKVKNVLYIDSLRNSLSDHILVPVNNFNNSAADCAEPENCHLYHNYNLLLSLSIISEYCLCP